MSEPPSKDDVEKQKHRITDSKGEQYCQKIRTQNPYRQESACSSWGKRGQSELYREGKLLRRLRGPFWEGIELKTSIDSLLMEGSTHFWLQQDDADRLGQLPAIRKAHKYIELRGHFWRNALFVKLKRACHDLLLSSNFIVFNMKALDPDS